MYVLVNYIEMIVGFVITFAVLVSIYHIMFGEPMNQFLISMDLTDFLGQTIEIILAIEFIKLIFTHSMNAIIEVMIITSVRLVIVGHPSPVGCFFSVISIGTLFLIRKYLFIPKLDSI